MAETKYRPVPHDHAAFLKRERKRRGFQAAYKALAVEYAKRLVSAFRDQNDVRAAEGE